jgi:hypothetical protein
MCWRFERKDFAERAVALDEGPEVPLDARLPDPRRPRDADLRLAAAGPKRVTFIGERLDLDSAPAHALGMNVVHPRPEPGSRRDIAD